MPPEQQATLPYRLRSAEPLSGAPEDQDHDQDEGREATEHVYEEMSQEAQVEEVLGVGQNGSPPCLNSGH